MDSVNEMQDDTPWKPPADAGSQDAPPTLPDAPTLPSAPVTTVPTAPGAPSTATAAPAAPAAPAPASGAGSSAPELPSLPPSVPTPPVAPPASVPPPPVGGHVAPAPVPGADAVVVRSSAPPKRTRRSKWLVGGALAAVVATGAAGTFAVANLTGSTQGGAATPDELGMSLLAAIENEDVLGVVDVLSPGERDVFRDPLVDLVSELTRLEVLSPDADLSRILGVDVELSNESVSAVSTNVPDITNVDLRADAVLTLDGAELPVGALITDNLPSDMLTEMRGTRLTETDELDIRLTAVEEDGRWYFSVFHTIAEIARDEVAPGMLIPLEGIGADGAETPDAAFDAVLDRVEDLDLTGILRTLNPGEAAALQRYAPLFLEEAEVALDGVPIEWSIVRREFRTETSGDTATVFVDALGVEGTVEDESFSVEFADGCLRAEAAGESFEQCEDAALDGTTELFAEAPEIERLFTTVTEAFADIEEVGLEMRRTDGLWYVSPVSTGSEAVLAVFRALDRSELDAIIDQVPAAADELAGLFFGGFGELAGGLGGFDGDVVFDEDVTLDEGVIVEESTSGTIADPGVDATITVTGGETCYSEPDIAVAQTCFADAVAAGDLAPEQVPLVLRHPECGYTAAWGGGIYSLSDADFIAAAEQARPCFLDLVEQGVVDEFELPTEISNLECFEGRNWYNVFDDPEYDERYYECLAAAFGE